MNELQTVSTIKDLFFQGHKTRQDILEMEETIKNAPTRFKECPYPLYQFMENGIYTREIHMKAGHLVCSKIHKDEYFVTMLKGRCWFMNEYEAKELIAPSAFTVRGGAKNILFILEDTVWIDTHNVKSETISEAEEEIFVGSYEEFDEYKGTLEFVKEPEIKTNNLIDQPDCDHVEMCQEKIFATEDIKKESIFALSRLLDHYTLAGKYVNYSENPNAKRVVINDIEMFVATADINKGDEITISYLEINQKDEINQRGVSCLDG